MAKETAPYKDILVESYESANTSGLHGSIHIRPLAGQGYRTDLRVECAKALSSQYPVGTKFKIRAKLTDREGEGEFLYSSYRWPYEVIK